MSQPRAMCYCGRCEMPFICCTQWDCAGANEGHHSYDCEYCENKVKAFKAKQRKKSAPLPETEVK